MTKAVTCLSNRRLSSGPEYCGAGIFTMQMTCGAVCYSPEFKSCFNLLDWLALEKMKRELETAVRFLVSTSIIIISWVGWTQLCYDLKLGMWQITDLDSGCARVHWLKRYLFSLTIAPRNDVNKKILALYNRPDFPSVLNTHSPTLVRLQLEMWTVNTSKNQALHV